MCLVQGTFWLPKSATEKPGQIRAHHMSLPPPSLRRSWQTPRKWRHNAASASAGGNATGRQDWVVVDAVICEPVSGVDIREFLSILIDKQACRARSRTSTGKIQAYFQQFGTQQRPIPCYSQNRRCQLRIRECFTAEQGTPMPIPGDCPRRSTSRSRNSPRAAAACPENGPSNSY